MATPKEKMDEYVVVTERGAAEMGVAVTEKLREGFRPWGQMFVWEGRLFQPMTWSRRREKK